MKSETLVVTLQSRLDELDNDIVNGVGQLTKSLNLMEERFRRQEDDFRQLRTEHNALAKDLSAITTRVAVLETERKTISAEVETTVTRTLAGLERRYIEAEASLRVQAAQDEAKRQSPRPLPSSSGD